MANMSNLFFVRAFGAGVGAAFATAAAVFRVGAADALLAALFSLYYVGESKGYYQDNYADYNKIHKFHFYSP